jgi:predicted PurR-regulated permease PerM
MTGGPESPDRAGGPAAGPAESATGATTPAAATDYDDRSARLFMRALLALSGLLVALMILPFASAFLVACVLAVSFHPWHQRVVARLGGRARIAAAAVTLGVALLIVLPVVTLGVVAVRKTVGFIEFVHDTLEKENVEGLIRRVPPPARGWAERSWESLPRRERNREMVFAWERRAMAQVPRFANLVANALLQSSIMILALYFLLLDGHRLLAWFSFISPLRRQQVRELAEEFRRVSVAVLMGSIATAGAQAIVALVGYAIVRAPEPLVLTLATFLFGLVPVIGAGAVTFAAAVGLYFMGNVPGAIFLAIWAVFVVGLVDNVLKPWLIQGGIEVHGGIVLFSLISGFAVFGMVGFILGPLAVTFFLAALKMYRRDFPTRATS